MVLFQEKVWLDLNILLSVKHQRTVRFTPVTIQVMTIQAYWEQQPSIMNANTITILHICRTVVLRKFFCWQIGSYSATHSKNVYLFNLLHRKSCARFGLNFSIFLLCENPRWKKNPVHVNLLGKNINKPLVHFY